jgi:hypothetical protein
MSIEFETKVFVDYASLVCTGQFSIEAMLRIYEEAFEFARKSGRGAVLIDARNISGREPTLAERYEQAVRVADMQTLQRPRIRLALLGHEPMIHPERFGEIVATNRGALARVFTDETVALAWLLAPSSQA